MIIARHLFEEAGKLFEPNPTTIDHEFMLISSLATVILPLGGFFTEITLHSIIVQGAELSSSTIATYVGSEEEMAPVIAFVYYYMTQAQEPSALSTAEMLRIIQDKIAARGNHPSPASEVPPTEESKELRRAVLFACGIRRKDELEEGLRAPIAHCALAAIFAEGVEGAFLAELREIADDEIG